MRDFPGLVLLPGLLVVSHSRAGPFGGDLLKEAFQRGTLAGSFSSRLGTRQSCRGTRFEYPSGPSPCHSTVQVYREPYGLSTRALRPTGSRRLVSQRPLPDYEPGWCEGDTEVHSILRLKGDWQIQLSGPCGPYSGGRLVLDPSG